MPVAVVTLALIALAGCNQILGTSEAHHGTCDPGAAFTHVAPVGGLESDLGAQSAQLSRDELTVLFSRLTTSGPEGAPIPRYGDLYMAHRDHLGDDFGHATPLNELNTNDNELGASLSEDQHTLYFARGGPSLRYQIFAASWPLSTGQLGNAVPVPLGDAAEAALEPYITSRAIFYTARRANGSTSLFTATGQRTSFGAAQRLQSLETEAPTSADGSPVVSSDELTIYFSAPADSASPADIWASSRATLDQPFGAPRAIAELNTLSAERPAWISDDSCRLYFVTNRGGRGDEVWMASRAAP